MKTINKYITEKLKISKPKIKQPVKYTLFPKDKSELKQCIFDECSKKGDNADLNNIDTSQITDMSYLFEYSTFNGDVSLWDVSNVTNMMFLFSSSKYDGDLSKWKVSKCRNMLGMFKYSKFTGENGDISEWDVSNVLTMKGMFGLCPFNQDISRWKINPRCNVEKMFIHNTTMEDRNKPILP
jgi:hypothetical protein